MKTLTKFQEGRCKTESNNMHGIYLVCRIYSAVAHYIIRYLVGNDFRPSLQCDPHTSLWIFPKEISLYIRAFRVIHVSYHVITCIINRSMFEDFQSTWFHTQQQLYEINFFRVFWAIRPVFENVWDSISLISYKASCTVCSRMRRAGHVARVGEMRGVYRVLVATPEGNRPLGRPRSRWEDNIKMDLQEADVGAWTGLSWLRIWTGGWHLLIR